MSLPLVSVVIPTFNRASHLSRTLTSIVAEEYPAKEIVVVDDGSTDHTGNVCARFPVRYLRQVNRGGSAARNAGVAASKGELLLFLDDDDICVTGSLAGRVRHWLAAPDHDFVLGKLRRFSEENAGGFHFLQEPVQILCLGAGLMTRRGFERAGGFDEALAMGRSEDVDLWLRMRGTGQRLKFIDDLCLYYRRHPGNATQDDRRWESGFLQTLHRNIKRSREKP